MKRLAQIPAPAAAFGMFEAAPAHETRDLPGFVIEGVTYASHHITLTVARAGRYTAVLLYAIWDTYGAARRGGAEEAASRIKTAFVEGRLRKRKQKGESRYRVWIEPQTSEAAISSELTQLRETL